MKLRDFIVLIIPILVLGTIALNKPSQQLHLPEQQDVDVIADLYELMHITKSISNVYLHHTASGLWFFHNNKLAIARAIFIPKNDTYAELDFMYREGDEVAGFVETVYTPANLPGKQFVFAVYPYDNHIWHPSHTEFVAIAVGITKYDESTGKYEPYTYLGDVSFSKYGRDEWKKEDLWGAAGAFVGYPPDLSAEGYKLVFDSNRYPIDKMIRTLYMIPKTISTYFPDNNVIVAPMLFDNIIVYDTQDEKYKVYTILTSWYLPNNLVEASGPQYILKYVDNHGNLVNDTVGQKIPILYLQSPLEAAIHYDVLILKLLEDGNIQFVLAGILCYEPFKTPHTIDDKIRILYDIPGVSPDATCYVSPRQAILPSRLNPYTTKAYLLTENVEITHWEDEVEGVMKFALKNPIRIALYDTDSMLFVILRINNVTLRVPDYIEDKDICHYRVESIDVDVEAIYDLSAIAPNKHAAEITLFDVSSPRAKYYGPLFFRTGTYDPAVGFNPYKIIVYRYSNNEWKRYVIEDRITPEATMARFGVYPERISFTWYGSSLLPFVQTDYDGTTVTKAIYDFYIVVPVHNITAKPKMFTYTVEYDYAVTPIDITYIKQDPDEPDELSNILIKLEITDPDILSSIATADARDIRFFEDNSRAGDYWKDVGLTYGIEEYIPGHKLVVYVLIPHLYANTTKTIYMYTGFPYAEPVAQSVDSLLARYPVLIPSS